VTPRDAVTALLRPRSIAVVGASGRPGSFGRRLLDSLAEWRHADAVYPVNPRYAEIAGRACYPRIADLPSPVDCVLMAVADARLEAAFEEAAAAGARAAVVFGRGYEASPAAGRPPLAERLGTLARAAGMAVCGSNCMGFMNFVDRLKVCAYTPALPDRCGAVGLVSHSGSSWSGLIGNQRQLFFNYAISAGQEIATTVADYLAFLVTQPETRAVALVLETVRDPGRFVDALALAGRRDVPVVALKLGRTERGARFTLAHTGALAGCEAAFDAVCERCNVCPVETLDELADTLELLSSDRRPPADGLAVVTDSGGERQMIVDLAADARAQLADLGPETRQRLEAVLDPGFTPDNPLDAWGDGRYVFKECLQILADDPAVGVVAMASNMVAGRPYLHATMGAVEAAHAATAKPVVAFGNLHSTICRDEAARLRGLGIPVLMGTATALRAIRHFLDYQHRRRIPLEREPAPADPTAVARWRQRLAAGPLSAPEGLRLFADFGGPVVAGLLAASEAEAVAAAERIGFPVVLKTVTPEVAHKTDAGGVALDLAGPPAVAEAYRRVAARFGPEVELQARVPPGPELLLGTVNDLQFGPTVTVALGGVLVELLQDKATFLPPVTAATALAHLRRLKGFPLLTGYRGARPVDLPALAAAIERFSVLAAEVGPLLAAFEINPLIAGHAGAVAVDALAVPLSPPTDDPE
jgi:acyl-CoA synthetase (NDP forming)